MPSKDIVILGGGVIGLCCAYFAMQRGHCVTIIERGSPAHDGCSQGNAGMIVPSHFVPLAAPGMIGLGLRMLWNPESPFAIKPRPNRDLWQWAWKFARTANAAHVARSAPLLRDLNLLSRRLYAEFAAQDDMAFGLQQRGLLMLCKTETTLREETHIAEMARTLGLPAEVLTPEAAAERDPGLRMDIAGAVYFPQDCHLSPQQFTAALTRNLRAGGANFCYDTEVVGWELRQETIAAVRTTGGDIGGDEFVLAAGAWSPEVVRQLGIALPVQAGKGYSITLPDAPYLPSLCSILVEARVAVTPMDAALRFAGTMEIAGLDERVNVRRVNGIRKAIPSYFPDYAAADLSALPVWSGLRPCSPNGLPYIGRFAAWKNLSAATGHAMMGLSLGPVTGLLLSEILSDVPPSLDIAALRPDR